MGKRANLAQTNPILAAEFDQVKNGEARPEDFTAGSDKKVWWIGSCGHSWNASVGHRARGRGCPICSGTKVQPGTNDLQTTHPLLAEEFHKSKNGTLRVDQVSKGSNRKVWWLGGCGHEWQATISHRANGTQCPICDGKTVVPGVNDLATTHPEVAKYWSVLNEHLSPSEVHAGSPRKVWFRCDLNHIYQSTLNSKTRMGLGCPVCSMKILVKGTNDLATTHPRIASRWHPEKNGKLSPSDVTVGSRKKVWFICEQGHDYEQIVRSSLLYSCNKCSGRLVISGENDLATLRPDIAAEWDFRKNELLPSEVMLGSDYKAWWLDAEGHSWHQGVQVRSRGVGCPQCAKAGYDKTSPGILYFIRNEKYGARKIGITNVRSKSDRINGFKKIGWNVIATFEHPDGQIILNLETQMFRWIRKELHLPPYLGSIEMGRMSGGSETFSGEGISDDEVIRRINTMLDGFS